MGGPTDFVYVTPEELFKIAQNAGRSNHTLGELKEMAKDDRLCEICGAPVWKYGGCGLCFTCTTGEVDASNDYELK